MGAGGVGSKLASGNCNEFAAGRGGTLRSCKGQEVEVMHALGLRLQKRPPLSETEVVLGVGREQNLTHDSFEIQTTLIQTS